KWRGFTLRNGVVSRLRKWRGFTTSKWCRITIFVNVDFVVVDEIV
ncbi:13783_t:CDS:2, partial [Gigaspora rosea]